MLTLATSLANVYIFLKTSQMGMSGQGLKCELRFGFDDVMLPKLCNVT